MEDVNHVEFSLGQILTLLDIYQATGQIVLESDGQVYADLLVTAERVTIRGVKTFLTRVAEKSLESQDQEGEGDA